MEKIQMTTPLVELDGDEMTRVLWRKIKEELIEPYVDLRTEYYDLGLLEREATKDQVTVDAARAIARYGVGGQVRHDHAKRPARGGIPPQPDVEKSQRDAARSARRNGISHTHAW